MKTRLIGLVAAILFCLSGCGSENVAAGATPVPASERADRTVASETEESDMESQNRAIIAEALEIDESARNIRFILNCLNTINAGKIEKAEATEENGEKSLDLLTENHKRYRIYLSGNLTVEAVKNRDTGEWLIQSYR